MKLNKNKKEKNCRLGKVGGEAVLEGVMMLSGEKYSVATRRPDGSIVIKDGAHKSLRRRNKLFNIPILRGCISMVESMILSFKVLSISADNLGIDESEPETKFEKWLDEKLGDKLMNVVMGIASVLGVVLGVGLFMLLPTFATKGIDMLCGMFGGSLGFAKTLVEGIIRIAIFIGYILLVSLMPDIRRTFEYHGAEHKSIACYESGDELTPENAKKHTRFHPRCGTSFIFFVLIVSIIIFSFVTWDNIWIRVGLKFLLLPIVVGLSFELIMVAGKHPNVITRIFSAPGLAMQRITTREPDEKELEVAIAALKSAMPDEFPKEDAPSDNAAEKTDGENTTGDAADDEKTTDDAQ